MRPESGIVRRRSILTAVQRSFRSVEWQSSWFVPLLLIIIAGAHQLWTIARPPVWHPDAAVYIGLARSLVNGQGYLFSGEPNIKFPPGLPLLLTPVVALFGLDTPMLQRYVVIWTVLGAVAFLAYLKTRRDIALSIALLIFLASSAIYHEATTRILSEPFYMTLSIGVLLLAERVTRSGRPSVWLVLGGAVLIMMTIATRTIGVALVAAIVLTTAQQLFRSWRPGNPRPRLGFAITGVVAGMLFIMGWSLWVDQQPHPAPDELEAVSYTNLIKLKDPQRPDLGRAGPSDLAHRLAVRFIGEGSHIARLLINSPWLRWFWFSPLILALLLLVGVGWGVELRRPGPLAAWYTAAYLAILLLWPYVHQGDRFSLPILPLLIIFLVNGVQAVARWISAHDGSIIGRIGIAVALVGLVGTVFEMRAEGIISLQGLANFGGWSIVLAGAGAMWAFSKRLSPAKVVTRLLSPAVALYLIAYLGLGAYEIGRTASANMEGNAPPYTYDELREAASWILLRTDPDAVIMTQQAAVIHMATGRRIVHLPVTTDRNRLLDALSTRRPQYLLIVNAEYPFYSPTEIERLELIQAAGPGVLNLEHTFDAGWIYSVSLPK